MSSTYEPIATISGTGGVSSYTFSSIPSTYTDLVLVTNLFGTNDGVNTLITVNGSATGYSLTYLAGNGSSATSSRTTSSPSWVASLGPLGSGSSTGPFAMILNFMNYSNTTTYKTMIARQNIIGTANNGTVASVNLWQNTAAISSITFAIQGGATFNSTSTATLYGIKAE
jgi:hypothetical protein